MIIMPFFFFMMINGFFVHKVILLFTAGVGASQCSLQLVVKFKSSVRQLNILGIPATYECAQKQNGYLLQPLVAQQMVVYVYRCT